MKNTDQSGAKSGDHTHLVQAVVSSVLSSLATAAVGGLLVLYINASRRVERLKNLVAVGDALLSGDDDEREQLVAEEMLGVSLSKGVGSRRVSVAVAVVVCAWVAGMIAWVFYAPPRHLMGEWALIVLGVGLAAVLRVVQRRRSAQLISRHRRRVECIGQRGAAALSMANGDRPPPGDGRWS